MIEMNFRLKGDALPEPLPVALPEPQPEPTPDIDRELEDMQLHLRVASSALGKHVSDIG
jgi:hypothetical protein